jgi:glycosyltransferase involved in cell wall biosynthesis
MERNRPRSCRSRACRGARLRICIIGKFPPIQGGVSARTYWAAHGLARLGHEVHVVTNAKEAALPFRMHMRDEDWARCTADYGDGSVAVHWTDPVDASQSFIPMASPFVTKLAAIAGRVHSDQPFDLIYSHYLEPYGVAGHLAAEMAGVPHVVRLAGSDAGRLWRHPQFEALYDHVLRSAEVVIAVGRVAEHAIARGVAANRICAAGGFVVPDDLFTPAGPRLDIPGLLAETDAAFSPLLWGEFVSGRPHIGVYGKLGERKGSFALLAAMQRLKSAGLDVGIVALAHGGLTVEGAFRARALELGLADRILQIPFLPHWRVPEFLRGCIAVCCLEQGFPIEFHAPVTPREVLLCGTCLIASTELIRKLPCHERLPHGYGCVAIENVDDIGTLSESFAAVVRDPAVATAIGARGRRFALELQRDMLFPQALERILQAAAERRRLPYARSPPLGAGARAADNRFSLTQLAAAAIGRAFANPVTGEASAPIEQAIDLASASQVLDAIERAISEGRTDLRPLAAAVRIEIAIATAESQRVQFDPAVTPDPLFRVCSSRWVVPGDGIAELAPIRDPSLHILAFDYNVIDFLGAQTIAELPTIVKPGPGYIVAFASVLGRRPPWVVDELTVHILHRSDGSRSAAEIARELGRQSDPAVEADNLSWIERLFVHGLLWLRDRHVDAGARSAGVPARTASAP